MSDRGDQRMLPAMSPAGAAADGADKGGDKSGDKGGDQKAPLETLDGAVDRFVYRNDDNHYTVARFTVVGEPVNVTVVGELVNVNEGVPLRLHGHWILDKKWGRQFKLESYQLRTPETLVGIERFLGSGIIPGVGAELARRLVEKFGMDTLEIIGREPHRLTEVAGIGAARAGKIAEAWSAQHHVQDVMVFLRGHGVSPGFAARIVKRYGKDAINVVRENPYRLTEVWGIGFRTADGIAQKLGIARDAPSRIEAGLLHVLDENVEQGHLHLPDEHLITETATLLAVAPDKVRERLAALVLSGLVIRELLGSRGACSSLPWAYLAEVQTASMLSDLTRTPNRFLDLDLNEAISAFEMITEMQLAPQQREAVSAALLDKCVVITGGPGVGKTTIVKAITHLGRALGKRRVALAAPTGRAAKRMSEATAAEAMTIHRLLEYQPQGGTFARNKGNPLEADLIIVDEASMIDLQIFHALLQAIPPKAQLVLVGDIDQLPSVGAGAVLADVIASETVTVIRLTEIFRQAAKSRIVVSAHQINSGQLPDLANPSEASDFYFINREDPEAARATLVELVAERIPARFGFDPLTSVQVLTPMHRGELGTQAINQVLQARLNPAAADKGELQRGERIYRRGDKVMQLRNDYDRGVFNGDIGVISTVSTEESTARVDFGDGRIADYEKSELDQLVHAYAVSVHKSQGSEYAAVVIPVSTQHFMMLQRSLLYTAVTRGKRLVVLVGSKKAVAMAVRNAAARQRFTWLAERLRAGAEAGSGEDGGDGVVLMRDLRASADAAGGGDAVDPDFPDDN